MVLVLLVMAALATVALGDPSGDGERYVSVPWATDPNEGGRKIELRYQFNGGYACQYRFHRASARETDESVTIKVLAHKRELRQGEACTAVLGGGTTVVRLKRPLGDRELRHARTTDSTVIDTFP